MSYEAKYDFTAVEDANHLVSRGFVVVDLEQFYGVSFVALAAATGWFRTRSAGLQERLEGSKCAGLQGVQSPQGL
jgi:hypothetical protein